MLYKVNLMLNSSLRTFQSLRLSLIKCEKCFLNSNFTRTYSQKADPFRESRKKGITSTLYYVTAAAVLTVGMSYAAVPLYRMFCQAYSYGGTTATGHDASKVETMKVVKHKPIKIRFNADTASSMQWNFKPQQTEITVSAIFFLIGTQILVFFIGEH